MPHRDLDVLDAAERAADAVNRLIGRSARRLLHVSQMRDSVQSIGANISEGVGRRKGRDRDRSLEIARGETEETIRHFGAKTCFQKTKHGRDATLPSPVFCTRFPRIRSRCDGLLVTSLRPNRTGSVDSANSGALSEGS